MSKIARQQLRTGFFFWWKKEGRTFSPNEYGEKLVCGPYVFRVREQGESELGEAC